MIDREWLKFCNTQHTFILDDTRFVLTWDEGKPYLGRYDYITGEER